MFRSLLYMIRGVRYDVTGGGGPEEAVSRRRDARRAGRFHGHHHQEAEKPRRGNGTTFEIGQFFFVWPGWGGDTQRKRERE